LAAEIGIFFEGFVDQFFESRWEIGVEADRRYGGTVEDAVEDNTAGIAAKWESAGGHFVEDDAEGEEIGAGVEFPAADLFGGHIGDGADGSAGAGEMRGIESDLLLGSHSGGGRGTFRGAGKIYFGQAEVEDFGVAAPGDENIGGLDVTMDDALAVSGFKAFGDFDSDGD
jgi:hypothetical protein